MSEPIKVVRVDMSPLEAGLLTASVTLSKAAITRNAALLIEAVRAFNVLVSFLGDDTERFGELLWSLAEASRQDPRIAATFNLVPDAEVGTRPPVTFEVEGDDWRGDPDIS